MKYLFILLIQVFFSCNEKPGPKLYVLSVDLKENGRIDWYVHSSIGTFAPDYLQLSTCTERPFFTTFYLSGVQFTNDTLHISLYKNDYEMIDTSILKNIKYSIDTTGGQWNEAASRIGRLVRRHKDFTKPHFEDTYCPKAECQ